MIDPEDKIKDFPPVFNGLEERVKSLEERVKKIEEEGVRKEG